VTGQMGPLQLSSYKLQLRTAKPTISVFPYHKTYNSLEEVWQTSSNFIPLQVLHYSAVVCCRQSVLSNKRTRRHHTKSINPSPTASRLTI